MSKVSKAQIVQGLVYHQASDVLRNSYNRKKFARELCEILDYWSVEEIQYFVDEMRGLNFATQIDRETFLQFLGKWVNLEVFA